MSKSRINWTRARKMFTNGKDTAFIAEYYGTRESTIYNGLAIGKGKEPTRQELERRSPHRLFHIVRHRRSV